MLNFQIHHPYSGESVSNSSSAKKPNPSFPWTVQGGQWLSYPISDSGASAPPRSPDHPWHSIADYQAYYHARRRVNYRDEVLKMDLVFPGALSTPYSIIGTVKFEAYANSMARDRSAVEEFRVEGTGTIIDKTEDGHIFESLFRIVEGSGTGGLEGVSGLWTLKVEIDRYFCEKVMDGYYAEYAPFVFDVPLVFEDLNEAGAALL